MLTCIRNGKVIKASCCGFEEKDLWIQDGRITTAEKAPDQVIDAGDCYLLPGLVDIHTHGAMGVNYQVPGDFDRALMYAAGQGVTTVLPTIATRPMEALLAAIRNIQSQKEKNLPGAAIGGIHLEGPFITRTGAMLSTQVPCTVENFRVLADCAGDLLKVMTLAPERENAVEVIAEGVSRGVRMSIGHTEADYDTAMAAIDAGATGATHVLNVMPPFSHRAPGTVGAVLTEERVSCEVICDMIHLAPATVKLVRAAKGLEKMILISDSGLIAGLGDGEYTVDGNVRFVKDGVCRNARGALAASTFSMAESARRLVQLGFSLGDIARIGAYNPAQAVGLDHEIGTLETGKRADILFCDEAFHIKKVLTRGVEVPLSPGTVQGGNHV